MPNPRKPIMCKWCQNYAHTEAKPVRALLCVNCNHLIGNCQEDTSILEAAIAYLRHHASETGVS